MNDILLAFKKEVLRYYPKLSEEEWNAFQHLIVPMIYKKGAVIFPQTEVCKQVLFITEGLTASEYHSATASSITRFFKSNGLCTNVLSLFYEAVNDDRVFAITQVKGILIPKDVFLEYYLHSEGIGLYFRQRLLEVIIEDKKFITTKTIGGVKAQLSFLQEEYPEVILETPWKYIANFMGVTPAWLSRVLKKET